MISIMNQEQLPRTGTVKELPLFDSQQEESVTKIRRKGTLMKSHQEEAIPTDTMAEERTGVEDHAVAFLEISQKSFCMTEMTRTSVAIINKSLTVQISQTEVLKTPVALKKQPLVTTKQGNVARSRNKLIWVGILVKCLLARGHMSLFKGRALYHPMKLTKHLASQQNRVMIVCQTSPTRG